jgi:hypothetical protein
MSWGCPSLPVTMRCHEDWIGLRWTLEPTRGRTLTRSRFVLAGCLVPLLAVLSACGQEVAGSSAPSTPRSLRVTSSASWRVEGQRLIAAKNAHEIAPNGTRIANAGNWAYQSEPVNIIVDGEYTLQFQVPSTFNIQPTPDEPIAITFDYPGDQQFQIHQSGPFSLVGPSGQSILNVPVTVTHLVAAYPGYSVWIS